MSSVEIEDVLSSIRRLVSEDLRPLARPTTRLDAGSKLILTPALRVVTGVETTVVPTATKLAFEQNEADFLRENDASQALEAEASVTASPLQTLLDEIAQGDDHRSDNAVTLSNPAESSVATPASLEAVVAALGAAVTGQGWEGEQEAAPDPVVDWSDAVWAERALADVATIGAGRVEDAELIVEAEPMVAPWRTDEIWLQPPRPDATETSFIDEADAEFAASSPISEAEIADLAEAAAVAEILSAGAAIIDETAQVIEDEPRSQTAQASLFQDDEALMDEDALRDMVRDIIRQELQGDLGERITRNVRKLVRAEINRVMTSRDFE